MNRLWELVLKISFLLFSRIVQLHPLLYAHVVHDERDGLLSSKTSYAERMFPGSISIHSFIHRNDARQINKFSSLWVLLQPSIGMQNPSPSNLTLVLQADLQEPVSLLFDSITHLFDP